MPYSLFIKILYNYLEMCNSLIYIMPVPAVNDKFNQSSKFNKCVLQGCIMPAMTMKNQYNENLTFCRKLFFISHLSLLLFIVHRSRSVDWCRWSLSCLANSAPWYVNRVAYVMLIDVYGNNTGNLYTKYNVEKTSTSTQIPCSPTITL